MSWNFNDPASRGKLMEVMNRAADEFTELVSDPDTWHAPTASGHWEVRDLAGHLVDTIEGYFPGFDAARGHGAAPEPKGLRVMDTGADQGALRFRDTPREELLERLRADRAKLHEIFTGLTDDEWTSLLVTHPYMGPLPAGFYPAFQLVDWGIHAWDIRQGTGRNHVLAADVADLLVPACLTVWQYTIDMKPDTEPITIGVRIASGHNAGTTRISAAPDGITFTPGDVSDLPAVIEFDPASFVLTSFGRINAGTAHGDVALADRFLNTIFRV